MSEVVVIIGASDKPQRFAYMAMRSLIEHGHDVRLVNPFKTEIEGFRCYSSVTDIDEDIDTVTLYVNPKRFHDHIDEVIRARPGRIIMNPGTEDAAIEQLLGDAGIRVQKACTLVLLSDNRF
jgi:uncharacterized protein